MSFTRSQLRARLPAGLAQIVGAYVGTESKMPYDIAAEGRYEDLIHLRTNADKNLALAGACFGGHEAIVRLMINCRADGWHGGLNAAAEGGYIVLMEMMIERCASLAAGVMYNACLGGHQPAVDYVIARHPDRSAAEDTQFWRDGFYGACRGGHKEIVGQMIERGVDDWGAGLIFACQGGHREIIDLMISRGANNWADGFRAACIAGDVATGRLMIEKSQGILNFTRVINAVCEYGHRAMIDLCLDGMKMHGWTDAEILNVINMGFTSACGVGNLEFAKIFYGLGAEVEWSEDLLSACHGGCVELVEWAIAHGADNWNAGLVEAASCGHLPIAELLIVHGADNWNSALEAACENHRHDIVELMVAHGATECANCSLSMIEHLIYP